MVGLFNFGETGGGYNSGFESLLYVDGHPYQGVDTNHNEVFFQGKEEKRYGLRSFCGRDWKAAAYTGPSIIS